VEEGLHYIKEKVDLSCIIHERKKGTGGEKKTSSKSERDYIQDLPTDEDISMVGKRTVKDPEKEQYISNSDSAPELDINSNNHNNRIRLKTLASIGYDQNKKRNKRKAKDVSKL